MSTVLITSLSIGAFFYAAALVFILRRTAGHATEGNLAEYFVSGRNVGLGTAIATLGATEIGLITIAYNAQKWLQRRFCRLPHRRRCAGWLPSSSA